MVLYLCWGELCLVFHSKVLCSIFIVAYSQMFVKIRKGFWTCFYIPALSIQNSTWYPYGNHDKYKKFHIQTKIVFSGLAKPQLQLARMFSLLTIFAQKPKPNAHQDSTALLSLEVFFLEKLRDVCQTVLAAQIYLC